MTGDLGNHQDRGLHDLLVSLWSKAVGQPGYEKAEWICLQQAVYRLEAKTPPDPVEPEPWEDSCDPDDS